MATETFIIEIRTRGTKKAAADVKRIGSQANNVRKTLAFMRNALVAVAAIRVFAKLTSDLVAFSDEMLVVKAVTNATTLEFARLKETAQGLGATTRFTAAEAAQGMAFLARAGFEVNEVLSAIPATLDLAAAAGLELGNAADIASNLMTSFGLVVADMPEIMDTLVFTANNANTTVQQLADGLKLFAPIASQLGISLKDAAAGMAILGDAGIQASLAGTGTRRVLTDLEAPTGNLAKALELMGISFASVRPSAVGFAGALQVLKDNGVGAAAASLLFGKRGGFVAAQLIRALGPMGDFRETLEEIDGTARDAAKTMEEGLGGALRLVRSAAQNLLITFGNLGAEENLNSFFRALAEVLREVARNADQIVKAMKFLAISFAAFKTVALIATLGKLLGLGKLWLLLNTQITFANIRAAFSFKTLGAAIRSIPFVAIIASLVLLGAGLVAFGDKIKVAGSDTETLTDVFDELVFQFEGAVTDTINAMGFNFTDFGDIMETIFSRAAAGIKTLVAVFAGLRAAVGGVFDAIKIIFKKFLRNMVRVITKFEMIVNSISNTFGQGDVFNLKDNERALNILNAEVELLTKNLEEGGTLLERFQKGGRDALASIEQRSLDRIRAEQQARILREERTIGTQQGKQRLEADPGRTDLAELLRGDGGAEAAAKKEAAAIEQLTDALRGLEASHFPLLAAQDAEAEVLATINDALDKDIFLRADYNELILRSTRAQIGANITVKQAAEEQDVLTQAWKDGAISLAELEFLQRKAAISFLDGQRDATSGAERAFLKLTQDATDAAAFTEMVFTDAFKSIEDAVVDFATTGTFSVNDFFRNFAEQLLRLGTQQAIAGIGAGFSGALGSLGGGGGALGGATGGFNIGNFVAGLFHDGGAFTVGAQNSVKAALPGLDNRLVTLGVEKGENVTVTPKNAPAGGGGLGAGALNVVFNVVTPDADSFNRSQSQLQNRLLAGIGQARRKR